MCDRKKKTVKLGGWVVAVFFSPGLWAAPVNLPLGTQSCTLTGVGGAIDCLTDFSFSDLPTAPYSPFPNGINGVAFEQSTTFAGNSASGSNTSTLVIENYGSLSQSVVVNPNAFIMGAALNASLSNNANGSAITGYTVTWDFGSCGSGCSSMVSDLTNVATVSRTGLSGNSLTANTGFTDSLLNSNLTSGTNYYEMVTFTVIWSGGNSNTHLNFNVGNDFAYDITPEPASFALGGAGLALMVWTYRRRKSSPQL